MNVRLVRAELRKMMRPLFAWPAVLSIVVTAMLAWGGQGTVPQLSAQSKLLADQTRPKPCATFGLPEGPECVQRQRAEARMLQKVIDQAHAAIEKARAFRSPIYAGRMAAGLMASFLGAVVLLLLTAGHVAQE